jgi:hypothetical protein
MPIEIIRRERPVAFWTAPERLYLTADGKVVGHADPRKATLLIAAGCEMPMEDAIRYGLPARYSILSQPVVGATTIDEPSPDKVFVAEILSSPEPNRPKSRRTGKRA